MFSVCSVYVQCKSFAKLTLTFYQRPQSFMPFFKAEIMRSLMEKDAIMEPDVWGLCQEFITHGDKADQVHRLIHYLSKGYTGYVLEAFVYRPET